MSDEGFPSDPKSADERPDRAKAVRPAIANRTGGRGEDGLLGEGQEEAKLQRMGIHQRSEPVGPGGGWKGRPVPALP